MIRALSFSLMFAIAALTSSISPFVQAAETETVTLDVPGMTCGTCPITVKYSLKKVPGVIQASADYAGKTATVTFDPDKTGVEALTAATAKAGYPSSLRQPAAH